MFEKLFRNFDIKSAYETKQTPENVLGNLKHNTQRFEKWNKLKWLQGKELRQKQRASRTRCLYKIQKEWKMKCGTSFVVHHVLNSEYSVHKSSFKLIRHDTDRK